MILAQKIHRESKSLFWLRFYIEDKQGDIVTFPWYDTFKEMSGFVNECLQLQNGQEHSDCEQSREVSVKRIDEIFELEFYASACGYLFTAGYISEAIHRSLIAKIA